IRFANRQLGAVAGDAGALAVTADGGEHWNTVPALVTTPLRSVAIASALDLMLVAGDGSTVLRSADAGATWLVVHIDGAGHLRGISTDPTAHRVLAVDDGGAVWASSDRGQTFVREASTSIALYGVSLHPDGTRALAVGARGTLLSRDAQGAWHAAASGTRA